MTNEMFDKLTADGWITLQLSGSFGEIEVNLSVNTFADTFVVTRYEAGMDEVLLETADVDEALALHTATCKEHA